MIDETQKDATDPFTVEAVQQPEQDDPNGIEGEHWVTDHLSSGRSDLPQRDVRPQPGGALATPERAS